MASGSTLRLLVCLGVSFVLAACSGAPQASTSLPSTSSAKPSSTLPPLGPPDFPVPDKARTQDAAGAKAALTYYLELSARQQAKSGQPLRDLSRGCELCTFLADRADQDAAAGYTIEGGQATIEEMPQPAVHEGVAEFALTISQAAVAVRDHSGNPVPDRGSGPIDRLTGAAMLTWSPISQAWIVTQLFFHQS